MVSKKKILRFESTFEGALFGIVTQLRDYQVCWYLNKVLSFELAMMDELQIVNRKKNKTSLYSWFRYEDELDKLLVYLVANKHSGEYLLPEIKQPDFLLLLKGEISDARKKETLEAMKKIPAFQLAVEIEYSKLKSKDHLAFD